jgi:TRAP-type transport system small permease protein
MESQDLMKATLNGNKSLIEAGAELFLVVTLAGMVVAVFLNVVLRYGFGTGIVFYEELSRLLFVWLVCVGSVLAAAKHQHLNFDMLTSRLTGRSASACTNLSRLIIAVCLALVAKGSFVQVLAGMASFSTVIGYPLALAASSTLIMSVAMLILLLIEFWQDPSGLATHALLSRRTESAVE